MSSAESLSPGSTNGPVDMSIALNLYAVEAGILVARLPSNDIALALRTRLATAEATCEAQGAAAFSILLNPLEQGLLLGCISDVHGQFASGLLAKLQNAVMAKLGHNYASQGFA
jgi:hypothetical protein